MHSKERASTALSCGERINLMNYTKGFEYTYLFMKEYISKLKMYNYHSKYNIVNISQCQFRRSVCDDMD